MIISSMCGVVTLQVGTATLAAVYLLLSALVIGINAFDYSNNPLNSWSLPLMLLSICAIIMVITGIIIFFCAYSESRSMCVTAIAFLIILWFYWIILSSLSLMNDPSFVRQVCRGSRCPETFWIANLRYRGVKEDKNLRESSEHHAISIKSKGLTQKTLKDNLRNVRIDNIMTSVSNHDESDQEFNADEKYSYILGLSLVGAVFFFVGNSMFIGYTILVVWAFAQEIQSKTPLIGPH